MKTALGAAIAVLVALHGLPANASTTNSPFGLEYDYGTWLPLSVKFPIWRKWQGYFEVQPRFQKNAIKTMTENQMRTGIGYQFNKNWSGFAGYFWSLHQNPEWNNEQRIWTQLGYQKQVGSVQFQNRFRCEDIWRYTYKGAAVRLRNQVRITKSFKDSQLYLYASDEPMYTLITRTNGPAPGFAQNRFIVGVGRRINWFTKVEVGYMNQYRNSSSSKPDIMNHALICSLALDFTNRKKQVKDTKLALKIQDNHATLHYAPQLYFRDLAHPASMLFDGDVQTASESGSSPNVHPAVAKMVRKHTI